MLEKGLILFHFLFSLVLFLQRKNTPVPSPLKNLGTIPFFIRVTKGYSWHWGREAINSLVTIYDKGKFFKDFWVWSTLACNLEIKFPRSLLDLKVVCLCSMRLLSSSFVWLYVFVIPFRLTLLFIFLSFYRLFLFFITYFSSILVHTVFLRFFATYLSSILRVSFYLLRMRPFLNYVCIYLTTYSFLVHLYYASSLFYYVSSLFYYVFILYLRLDVNRSTQRVKPFFCRKICEPYDCGRKQNLCLPAHSISEY